MTGKHPGLRAGIALMPQAKRRESLHENLERRLLQMFANWALSFNMSFTKADAKLLANSRAAGLAVETADALIAEVAIANCFAVATCDTSPLETAGIEVIASWKGLPPAPRLRQQ